MKRPVQPDASRAPAEAVEDPTELFRRAVAGAVPIRTDQRVPPTLPPPVPVQALLDQHDTLADSLAMKWSVDQALDGGDEPVFLQPGLPREVLRKLRRGHWAIEDALDLHGFTREEARDQLATFLARCIRRRSRCVRVIHGKGLGSPGREPVLKARVRKWLALREEVLAYCQAPVALGGSGALVVLLRA